METFSAFVMTHGYMLIFVWVFLDQLGVPVPAIPVLITGGALAGSGELNLGVMVASATLGALPSDLIWFEAGRRRGGHVLRTLCRVSLEPDSCVRSTEETFDRHGPRSLLVAKFVPGFQTLSAALAGMSGMSRGRFVLYEVPGAMIFCGTFIGLGFVFHNQLDSIFQRVSEFGSVLAAILVGGLATHVTFKFYQRQRFIRGLRTARIDAEEVMRMIDEGIELALYDLRNALAIEMNPRCIPAAQVVTLEDIDSRHLEIPRDRDIILYCD